MLDWVREQFSTGPTKHKYGGYLDLQEKDVTTPYMKTPFEFIKGIEPITIDTPIHEYPFEAEKITPDMLINVGLLSPPIPNSGLSFIQLSPNLYELLSKASDESSRGAFFKAAERELIDMVESKGYTGIIWNAFPRSTLARGGRGIGRPIQQVHSDLYPFDEPLDIDKLQPDCMPLEDMFLSDDSKKRFRELKKLRLVGSVNLWVPYNRKVTTSSLLAVCDLSLIHI